MNNCTQYGNTIFNFSILNQFFQLVLDLVFLKGG